MGYLVAMQKQSCKVLHRYKIKSVRREKTKNATYMITFFKNKDEIFLMPL